MIQSILVIFANHPALPTHTICRHVDNPYKRMTYKTVKWSTSCSGTEFEWDFLSLIVVCYNKMTASYTVPREGNRQTGLGEDVSIGQDFIKALVISIEKYVIESSMPINRVLFHWKFHWTVVVSEESATNECELVYRLLYTLYPVPWEAINTSTKELLPKHTVTTPKTER